MPITQYPNIRTFCSLLSLNATMLITLPPGGQVIRVHRICSHEKCKYVNSGTIALGHISTVDLCSRPPVLGMRIFSFPREVSFMSPSSRPHGLVMELTRSRL